MTRLYYIYPFGTSADDLTAIPTTPPVNGTVNYQTGWTDLYEQDLLTVPTAQPIPRGQMNQLFYDITNNIQQYQQYGVPFWITSSDNGGTPFSYAQYALANYGGIVYESQVASNTSTPGTDANWLQLSGNAQGVPIGTVIDYAGYTGISTPLLPNLPGYLLCDGSAVSRSTYADLLATLLIVETGTLTNTSPTITGLADVNNLYPGMAVEGTNIPSGTTILSINYGAFTVTLTQSVTGSGSQSVFFYPWGNGDGSTTFNLPDLRRKTTAGKFGTGSATLGNAPGQTGGTETNSLTPSQLPSSPFTMNITVTNLSNVTQGGSGANASALVGGVTPTATTVSIPGGGSAVNNIQPTAIMNKAIKYV